MNLEAIFYGTVGICLYILIPGLALSLAVFPRKQDMGFSERLILSAFLGMATPFILYFNDKNFIIPINPETSMITLGALTLIGLAIWQIRLRRLESRSV